MPDEPRYTEQEWREKECRDSDHWWQPVEHPKLRLGYPEMLLYRDPVAFKCETCGRTLRVHPDA